MSQPTVNSLPRSQPESHPQPKDSSTPPSSSSSSSPSPSPPPNPNSRLSQNLFLTSALLNALSIPIHLLATHQLGINLLSPHLATTHLDAVTGAPRGGVTTLRSVDRCTRVAFNYINVGLLVSAILNYQWSKTKPKTGTNTNTNSNSNTKDPSPKPSSSPGPGPGPRTTEEKLILWTLLLGNGVVGAQFARAGEWMPLGCLWLAPLCSAMGLVLA